MRNHLTVSKHMINIFLNYRYYVENLRPFNRAQMNV